MNQVRANHADKQVRIKRRGGYQVRPFVPVRKRDESRPSLPGNSWCSYRPNLDWSQIDVDHLHRIDTPGRDWCGKYSNPVHCIYDLQRQPGWTHQRQFHRKVPAGFRDYGERASIRSQADVTL